MSAMYAAIAKKNYDAGLWDKDMLKALVRKRKLTQTEYKNITGEDYEA